jgi:hypothetical protein
MYINLQGWGGEGGGIHKIQILCEIEFHYNKFLTLGFGVNWKKT